MNDFTKAELLTIKELIIWDDDEYYPPSARVVNIQNKIQSMIDNYKCNHESDGMCYTSLPPQNKCKKCGEFYR